MYTGKIKLCRASLILMVRWWQECSISPCSLSWFGHFPIWSRQLSCLSFQVFSWDPPCRVGMAQVTSSPITPDQQLFTQPFYSVFLPDCVCYLAVNFPAGILLSACLPSLPDLFWPGPSASAWPPLFLNVLWSFVLLDTGFGQVHVYGLWIMDCGLWVEDWGRWTVDCLWRIWKGGFCESLFL